MRRDTILASALLLASLMVWLPWEGPVRRVSFLPAADDPEAPAAAEELQVEAATEEILQRLDSAAPVSSNGSSVKRRSEKRRSEKRQTQRDNTGCVKTDIACQRAEVNELLKVSAAAKSRNAMLSSRQLQQRKAAEAWLCAPGNVSATLLVPIVALEHAAAKLRRSNKGRCKPSDERLEALRRQSSGGRIGDRT